MSLKFLFSLSFAIGGRITLKLKKQYKIDFFWIICWFISLEILKMQISKIAFTNVLKNMAEVHYHFCVSSANSHRISHFITQYTGVSVSGLFGYRDPSVISSPYGWNCLVAKAMNHLTFYLVRMYIIGYIIEYCTLFQKRFYLSFTSSYARPCTRPWYDR